ncbi:MAG: BatD family protein [Planctomycetota bacterium]
MRILVPLALLLGPWLALPAADALTCELLVPRYLPLDHSYPASLRVYGTEARITRLELPDVDKLELASDSRIHSVKRVNDRVWVRSRIVIRATDTGAYRIPPIVVHLADGRSVTCEPISGEIPEPMPELTGAYHARAAFDPTTTVAGARVLARWLLYKRHQVEALIDTPRRLPIVNTGETEDPETGVELLGPTREDDWGYVVGENAIPYKVTVLEQEVLFTRPGTYATSGQLDYGRSDVFGRFRRMGVLPVTGDEVEVVPLPETGRPAGYGGLVGEVELEATLDKQHVALGSGLRLRVSVSGERLDLLNRLALPEFPDVAVYPEGVEDTRERKVFTYDLVPERVGEYVLPAVSIPWFDPRDRSYKRATTQELSFTVIPGRTVARPTLGDATSETSGEGPDDEQLLGLDFYRGSGPWSRAPVLGWWLLIAGLLCGGLAGLSRLALARGRRRDDALGAARRDLHCHDLARVDAALHRLAAATGDPALRERLRACMQRVEHARFGGHSLSDPIREELAALARELRA